MNADIIYFSATGTTKKIVQSFAKGLDCDIRFWNITPPDNRNQSIELQGDVTIIAVPVYGERIPKFIYRFLKQLDGGGRPLAVLNIYGNMGYGVCLAQFKQYAAEHHFQLTAAGRFVGEHTYADKRTPVAYGRPDADDLRQAQEFGKQFREKCDSGTLCPLNVSIPAFLKVIENFPDKSVRFLIKKPVIYKNTCNRCGACVRKCPVGAIHSDTLQIEGKKCIRCFACVKGCPKAARKAKFRLPFTKKIFQLIGRKRKENQIIF